MKKLSNYNLMEYTISKLNSKSMNFSQVNEDGRVNSTFDEVIIKNLLDSLFIDDELFKNNSLKFNHGFDSSGQPIKRCWFDTSIINPDIFIPINIKSIKVKKGINLNSKGGIYYACTGRDPHEDKVENASWNKWLDMIAKYLSYEPIPGSSEFSDYYLIIANKTNPEKPFSWTSIKRLTKLIANPSNLPFQFDFSEADLDKNIDNYLGTNRILETISRAYEIRLETDKKGANLKNLIRNK